MVFQNYTLFPWLTVRDNVRFCDRLASGRAGGLTSAARNARAEDLLAWMGLREFAEAVRASCPVA